jgi:hypothetical protein
MEIVSRIKKKNFEDNMTVDGKCKFIFVLTRSAIQQIAAEHQRRYRRTAAELRQHRHAPTAAEELVEIVARRYKRASICGLSTLPWRIGAHCPAPRPRPEVRATKLTDENGLV